MMLRYRQRRRAPRRRHGLRPGGEALEPRIALSGTPVGVDLDSNDWYNDDPIWTDLHNLATAWTPLTGSAAVPLTTDGYPLVNAKTTFTAVNYPSGNYEFSYTGDGTVSFSGAGTLTGAVTVSGGVTSGTVAVNPGLSAGTIDMQVTGVNASDPMDNFHLMMPGYGNGTTTEPMFTPAFLQALAPFSDIRFVNWGATINSTVENWSQRVPPNAFRTDGTGGVPFEDMIALCNATQKDMWITIPAEANTQFVQDLAQLIASTLDPNLNVYVEYSDETWNTGYSEYGEVATAAKSNPLLNQSLSQYQLVAQQSAYEIVTDGQIFDQAFGAARASRVRPILGAQEVWDQFEIYELQFIQQQFGSPSQYIYAVGEAPYVKIPASDNVAGLTESQLFADLNQYLTGTVVPGLVSDVSVASQYGLPVVAYEGGQGLIPGANDLNFALFNQAQNDPRMYQLYVELAQDWRANGGGLFNAYQLSGGGSQYGYWGMLPNVTVAGSQKYDGLLAGFETPGDADFQGVVDWSDFQTLEANYGDGQAYWTQGDFNDDGSVNWADLNILRQNLDPAGFTLTQFAQQAVFGQPNTVDTPTALEYDGYGVTYASSMTLSSTSGVVHTDENSAGQPIVLGGASYTEGLGVSGGSSTTLSLNGAYSRFDSTIGVDTSGSTSSSVIFEVEGDGHVLYTSPTMSYGSTPIPIDLSVAGVQKLTLIVEAAPGSTAANDHAVWADARLISTANFGSVVPYTLSWQVSQNGQVVSTETGDSFVLPAVSGTYTVSLTVTNSQGSTATASTSVTVVPDSPSASYLMNDTQTQGDWMRRYGSQGYMMTDEGASLPDYASMSVSYTSGFVSQWTDNTTQSPALLLPGGIGATISFWAGSTITVDVSLGDGQTHDLALYAVDWGAQGRSELVQFINPLTNAVMSSTTLSSFSKGVYLDTAVSGNFVIKITCLTGPNAVLEGLFLDPARSTADTLDQINGTTEGNWVGVYGTQGYELPDQSSSLPSSDSITTGASTTVYASSTTITSALEAPPNSARSAIAWDGSSFTITVDLTDGKEHDLALYAVDWDGSNRRSEQVQLLNATTGAVLNTQTISAFSNGVYLQWAVSGDVEIKVTDLKGTNALVSGLFLDSSALSVASTATLLKTDTQTEGNWIGTYGSQGYDIAGETSSLPSYASITLSGAATYDWTPATSATRALQDPGGHGRSAVAWTGNTLSFDVNLTGNTPQYLTLYAMDWNDTGRTEQVQLVSAATGVVLDTETIMSFQNGVYLQWLVTGSVVVNVTSLVGSGAVVSGLFLDAPLSALSASQTFVTDDTTTQGNWIGSYGTQGDDLDGQTPSLPSYAEVNLSGASTYTWTTSTTDVRGLENPSGTGRSAVAWYGSSFSIDVDFTDGQAHDLALYAVDWDDKNRSEQIQITSAATGAVLSTVTLSSFTSGEYLQWVVTGNVVIKVTSLSGPNALISGLFFDPPPS